MYAFQWTSTLDYLKLIKRHTVLYVYFEKVQLDSFMRIINSRLYRLWKQRLKESSSIHPNSKSAIEFFETHWFVAFHISKMRLR
jgi:hypothetical protein